MATNNQINISRGGAPTGTGSYAGTVSPTFVTPTIGAATATSINFGASGTDGLKGVTSGSNAASGYVGEYKSASVLVGSAVPLTTATPANVVTLSLEAGDWDVSGTCIVNPTGGSTVTSQFTSLNTTSVTHATDATGNHNVRRLESTTSGTILENGVCRFSLSGTTTIYLVCTATITGGAVTATSWGFIGARRAR